MVVLVVLKHQVRVIHQDQDLRYEREVALEEAERKVLSKMSKEWR
jgi:hypothetical protein